MLSEVKSYLLDLQSSVCDSLSKFEPSAKFKQDKWSRSQGGGGITCILQGGDVFDSAGVNFSHVYGHNLPKAATSVRPGLDLSNMRFDATGVSIVIHPKNPFVPTSHMNVRFFRAHNSHGSVWWFGGGYDLTPYYVFPEDCIAWHQTAKDACDTIDRRAYPKYKKWADDYFYLKHRKEHRGIGGIFFDDLNQDTWGWDFAKCFDFLRLVGNSFAKAYCPLIAKRKDIEFGEQHKDFQLYRRGRYIEFNLLYDRGTLFGLQSNGRVESILMSLPPEVHFRYNYQPNGAKEKELLGYLQPKDWLQTTPVITDI